MSYYRAMTIDDIQWIEEPDSPDDEEASLPGNMRLVVSGEGSKYGDGSRACWYVDAGNDTEYATVQSGSVPNITAARFAAYEAWRRWAREQAEAAGWMVSEPGALNPLDTAETRRT